MSKVVGDITFISRCGGRYRNQELESLGLTARQSASLLEICSHPGISQDALSRRVALDKSNITRQLANLETAGLVERIPCQKDKRIIRLYPTGKAEALLPQVRHVVQTWENYLTGEFTPEELELMERLICRMKEKASQWMEVNRLG